MWSHSTQMWDLLKCDHIRLKCGHIRLKCDHTRLQCDNIILKCDNIILKCDNILFKCDNSLIYLHTCSFHLCLYPTASPPPVHSLCSSFFFHFFVKSDIIQKPFCFVHPPSPPPHNCVLCYFSTRRPSFYAPVTEESVRVVREGGLFPRVRGTIHDIALGHKAPPY